MGLLLNNASTKLLVAGFLPNGQQGAAQTEKIEKQKRKLFKPNGSEENFPMY